MPDVQALPALELHPIPDTDTAGPQDCAVEREQAVQLAMNLEQDAGVLSGRVRIKRRHDATLAQADDPDDRFTDVKMLPLPITLRETRDLCNQQIRTKPPPIVPEEFHRTVCRDQQWQHIEAVGALVTHETTARPGRRLHVACDVDGRPGAAVDARRAVGAQRYAVEQELGTRARRDDSSARIPNLDDAITRDAILADVGLRQQLAAHRLDRIPPDFCQPHGGFDAGWRCGCQPASAQGTQIAGD
jgi:hypothetical protein